MISLHCHIDSKSHGSFANTGDYASLQRHQLTVSEGQRQREQIKDRDVRHSHIECQIDKPFGRAVFSTSSESSGPNIHSCVICTKYFRSRGLSGITPWTPEIAPKPCEISFNRQSYQHSQTLDSKCNEFQHLLHWPLSIQYIWQRPYCFW